MPGYIYSEEVGWISLSCFNTASCDSIDYGVLKDSKGNLSGYGYSQNGEWINFNPNYGGSSIDSNSKISGWIFAQDTGWVNIDSVKIFSEVELQNKAESAKNIVSEYENTGVNNLSDAGAASLLSSLCNLLGISQCANNNN
ncbi:MAG: hypothetical protein NTY04_02455 [Candidatus Staskawiczbacteria bacterium]|nr:hypothetical protein [Candidatus Staskawiczbacteria bacterium]